MIINSLKGTKEFAENLAKSFLPGKKALVIGLNGELGSGKTTFVQFLAKNLGVKERILSPTFVIFKSFNLENQPFKKLYHFDFYRINDEKELLILGFEKIIKDKSNIVLIEWPNRAMKLLPSQAIILDFKFIDKNKREINVTKKTNNN
jgi:tRNA threonylcarbamoyladenosine biosynthesis protein TsaE